MPLLPLAPSPLADVDPWLLGTIAIAVASVALEAARRVQKRNG
ncbi:MAG TPA: hypothetical protein VI997_00025 [Candidatus Thermoplasmatota archaeon]|nr:hypothetical protein [Candidatus Thermoplasmatota archaeon]